MNKAVLITIILLVALAGALPAQDPGGGKIGIQAGISIYPNPVGDSAVYIEFPFSLNRNQFLFLPDDSSAAVVRAAIFAELIITDTLGNNVDSASTYFYTRASDSIEAARSGIRLFNKLSLALLPGIYKGQLDIIDVSSKREGSFLYDRIEVPVPTIDRLSLSSLELAHEIRILETGLRSSNPRMVKNEREIIPSPMGIFSQDDSLIYVYAELYNLTFGDGSGEKFRINYRVFNSDASLKFDFGEIQDEKPGASAVITSMLNIRGWDPGRYELNLTATDLASGQSAVMSRHFVIFPKAGLVAAAGMTAGTRSPLDTASLNTISNILKYVLSAQDAALFAALNDTGKVRFAIQYFRDRDPSPGTAFNEYLDDIFSRFKYTNENFSTLPGTNDGWKSDRGRVLLQYGFWSDRDEVTAPAYGRPWERWYFRSLQGGVFFIFEDADGYGDYHLVHSTAKGETFNSDWDRRVKDENLEIY